MGYGTTRRLADGSGYRNTIRGGVEIRISMSEIAKRMRRLKAELPALRAKAFKTQMKTILNQLRSTAIKGGGKCDVPKFHPYEEITKDIRRAKGKDESGPIGGWLVSKNAFRYDALTPFTSMRPKVRIGWVKGAEDSAVKFQIGAGTNPDAFTNREFRHYIHKITASDDIPSAYVHNERQLIEPFEGYVTANLQKWIDGYVRKTLAHQIAKEMRGRLSA